MHNGAGDDMQQLFPEGHVFFHALYGLGWGNLIEDLDRDSKIFKEGLHEMEIAINEIDSEKGRRIFEKDLTLPYGVFYGGWRNILLGKFLMIQREERRSPIYVKRFELNCKLLAEAYTKSETPYLESYTDQTWPADNVIGMASIGIHDKILSPKYEGLTADWLKQVKKNLDPNTGLIPHKSSASKGESIEGARGSSQSLILNFLPEIDRKFANDQFTLYKALFLDYRLGLPGIREYPKGTAGLGDVDSGPVVWGIGASASIVGQRTMYKYGEMAMYCGLRNSIEGFGVGLTLNKEKRFLFGALPMADAFIAWSNSLEKNELTGVGNWRWQFQLNSMFLLIGLLLIYLKIR